MLAPAGRGPLLFLEQGGFLPSGGMAPLAQCGGTTQAMRDDSGIRFR